MDRHYRVGVTFGAFDPLHMGHILLFEKCKKYCEKLVVGVSSDDYIRTNKDRDARFPLDVRLKAAEGIKYVDFVTWQDQSHAKRDIALEFDAEVIFVGSDWYERNWDGEDLNDAKAEELPIIYIPRFSGLSSTELMEGYNNVAR